MMKVACGLVVAAALAVAAGAQASTPILLKGETGPGFKVEVTTAAGKDVKVLKAGTYRLVVEDKSSIHNFRLKGPGLKPTLNLMVTTVPFTGKKTVIVKLLKKGIYTYQCDPHAAAGMKGTFKVV